MRRLIPFLIVAVGLLALAVDVLPEFPRGVAEPVVQTLGSDRIVVELPGPPDQQEIRRLIGSTGRLDFVPIPTGTTPPGQDQPIDPTLPALFAGSEIDPGGVSPGFDQQTGQRTVNFKLKSDGAKAFADYSRANVGQYFAIVLSVGMAVDANILIFERTKEELRAGKTITTAIEAGFNRAWNSILDSNVSSLITAGILYYFGSSTIRGFALVLIIGVLVSMFTAITVSRSILRWVVRRPWARRARLYGVH